MEHARVLLLRWFDLRARFGFSEFHSNVYYQKDLTPLLTLAEYADDGEIQTRASMVLDLLLFDLAMHTHRGAFGVTHGRSAKKDKNTSLDDDTWGGVKLLFDRSTFPYQSRSHPDATLLARAWRYRVPEAILRVAQAEESFVDRERMGIDVDPFAPLESDPAAPYEFSFSDPEDLPVWWGIGALTPWQMLPLTLETMNEYDLWETELFQPFAGLKPLAGNIPLAQTIALGAAPFLTFGLLREVNTYTYRTADYMLSSALDYRKGSLGWEHHSWQATFDANAVVFTTHPALPPVESTDWAEDPEPGYWSGEASMPRSAQHENVAIHIYAPQWDAHTPPPLDFFSYEPYTHAYFPQDHFDEVVREGAWTFGRLGDGYVALYSHRPADWVVYDPAVIATNGMVKPFDLRASGGPDNVWIVECGRATDWGSFASFREVITASQVEVAARAPTPDEFFGGFDVSYESPSQGVLSFGWTAPLLVQGVEMPVTGFRRYDNPWSKTEFNTRRTRIEVDGYVADLDFEAGVRKVEVR